MEVRRRRPRRGSKNSPSVPIEAAIEAALLSGLEEPDRLTELGRLGARLVLQRALADELEAFLGRARYERTEMATGSRNGHRPRRIPRARFGAYDASMGQDQDATSTTHSAVLRRHRRQRAVWV